MMNSFYPLESQQHSVAIQPESAASSAQISQGNGLIVSEDDPDRPDLQQQRAQGNVHEDTVFPRIVRRLSRARWFCLIRRIFHYQNGREGSDVRLNPLNTGTWICFEVAMVLAQIVSALVILVLSRYEKPVSPLRLWVVGYAFGCCVSLPLLYWRYKHPCFDQISHVDQNSNIRRLNFSSVSSHARAHDYAGRTAGTDPATINSSNGGLTNGESRLSLFMERCRMSLDFFFAVWFVIGNVWVFGTRREFAEDAPSLYRLCIALLALSCIGYALPFILFAVLCCCMPCISTLFGYDLSSQAKERGASTYDIAALPTHRFKSMSDVKRKNERTETEQENDTNYGGGGYIILDTAGRKRSVSPEDAECCICLTKYKDSELLKELPCAHLFHVGCVDQWLKINSSCPLCKRQLNGSRNMADHISPTSRYDIFF